MPDKLTRTAMTAAGLMLAHQVAGKAVRDSFFLSHYSAADLPRMVILSAGLTIVFVLIFSRVLRRFGPRRVVPGGFLLSAALHGAEYMLTPQSPKLLSVLIYVHIVSLGAILLSGFWSQTTEAFDPRTAKQVFSRITGAGTLGGIAGGVLAERVAAMLTPTHVLLLLAAFHVSCAVFLGGMKASGAASRSPEDNDSTPARDLLQRAPFLGPLALMVVAGTGAAAILDYLFKASAGQAFGKDAPLLRFFAIFYTSTQILTFATQSWLAPRALRRFGIGKTLSALPAAVGFGALGALLIPAAPVLVAARALESSLRGSLFRSAYELLFTPMLPVEKRAAKTLIDVACDRAGDALGGAIVQVLIAFGAAYLTSGCLGVMLALAVVGGWAALRLDREYAALIEQRLVDRAVELDIASSQGSASLYAVKPASSGRDDIALTTPRTAPAVVAPDPVLGLMRDLRSGDPRRVLHALDNLEKPRAVIAAQLISLLAWDEVSDAVRDALIREAPRFTGLLTDYLTAGTDSQFGIRRRIPRILAHGNSQLAVHGLVAGLRDSRFEVRFQCSRALDSLLQRNPSLCTPPDEIFQAVERELQVARPLWESRQLLDTRDESDPYAFFDEHLRERADRSLEHVFSLLGTVLPREPVKIAFRALHTDDRVLRNLAFEYLEGVLPPGARTLLWPIIEPRRATTPLRPREEVVADLVRSHESLLMLLPASGRRR